MGKVKIAIVGCGWFGNVHLDSLLKRDNVEVVALVNRGEEALAKTATRVPSANKYTSFDDMLLGEAALEAIVLCVPPHTHAEMEIKAAQKGIHMYIEKPLSNNLQQASAFNAAIIKSGIICSVGYQERYSSGMQQAKEAALGQVPGIALGRWIGSTPGALWWQDKAKSGGQIVEQVTHVVDLMRYFLGEAESVFAFPGAPHPAGFNVDSSSVANIRFKNGVVASLSTACFLSNSKMERIGLQVYAGDIEIDISWFGGLLLKTKDSETFYENKKDNHARALAVFIDAVVAKNSSGVLSYYADAMESFKLTMAIEKSMAENRVILLSELE